MKVLNTIKSGIVKTIAGFFLTSTLLLSFSHCAREATSGITNSQAPDMHTSQNSLDWAGTYSGTLPCADCPGIDTKLTLNDNNSYRLTSIYQDRSSEPFIEEGTFEWLPNGSTIVLKDGKESTRFFMVGENHVTMLNREGIKVEGQLARNYMLSKTESQAGKSLEEMLGQERWQLTHIYSKPLEELESTETPFIKFTPQEKRINGNAGCNLFFGTYQLKEPSAIGFSQIGATKKYCPGMEIEDKFLKALNNTTSVKIDGNTLTLLNAGNKEIAVFENRGK